MLHWMNLTILMYKNVCLHQHAQLEWAILLLRALSLAWFYKKLLMEQINVVVGLGWGSVCPALTAAPTLTSCLDFGKVWKAAGGLSATGEEFLHVWFVRCFWIKEFIRVIFLIQTAGYLCKQSVGKYAREHKDNSAIFKDNLKYKIFKYKFKYKYKFYINIKCLKISPTIFSWTEMRISLLEQKMWKKGCTLYQSS